MVLVRNKVSAHTLSLKLESLCLRHYLRCLRLVSTVYQRLKAWVKELGLETLNNLRQQIRVLGIYHRLGKIRAHPLRCSRPLVVIGICVEGGVWLSTLLSCNLVSVVVQAIDCGDNLAFILEKDSQCFCWIIIGTLDSVGDHVLFPGHLYCLVSCVIYDWWDLLVDWVIVQRVHLEGPIHD